MTWSACRTCSSSKSREFLLTDARSVRSPRPASARSSQRNSELPELYCRRISSNSRSDFGTEDNDVSLIFLFALLLILCFGVLLYFLRPTAMEKAVAQQLADVGKSSIAPSGRSTILKEGALRSNTIADELIDELPWSGALTSLIKQSGKDWRASSVFLASLAISTGAAWLIWMMKADLVIACCVGIALGAGPCIYLYVLREIRRLQFATLLPEAVDLMSRGLRAGHSIAAVLEMVGNEIGDPVGFEFRALHKEQALGLPLRDGMMNLVERMPRDDMRFIATAILLQKESGGNLAQILDKTSNLVRER